MVLAMALASSCLAKLPGEVTDAAGGGLGGYCCASRVQLKSVRWLT
jgi:hypothetical protein